MSDLISRQAAIEAINRIFPAEPMRNDYTQGITCGAALATEFIEALPSAQSEPSAERHGRWLRPRPVPQVWSLFMADCSECGKITYMGDYCMECGAKMERDDE